MLHFSEVASWVEAEGIQLTVPRVHGIISGYIAAGGNEDPGVWPVRCLGKPVQSSDMQRLFFAVQSGLSALDFSFTPLLVSDEEPLKVQVGSLVEWVEAFVMGIALSDAPKAFFQGEDIREAVTDLADMTRLDVAHIEDDEASQTHFVELAEYARTLALFIYTECHFLMKSRTSDDEPDELADAP